MDVLDRDDGRKQGVQLAARPTTSHPARRGRAGDLAGHVPGNVDSGAVEAVRAVPRVRPSAHMVCLFPSH